MSGYFQRLIARGVGAGSDVRPLSPQPYATFPQEKPLGSSDDFFTDILSSENRDHPNNLTNKDMAQMEGVVDTNTIAVAKEIPAQSLFSDASSVIPNPINTKSAAGKSVTRQDSRSVPSHYTSSLSNSNDEIETRVSTVHAEATASSNLVNVGSIPKNLETDRSGWRASQHVQARVDSDLSLTEESSNKSPRQNLSVNHEDKTAGYNNQTLHSLSDDFRLIPPQLHSFLRNTVSSSVVRPLSSPSSEKGMSIDTDLLSSKELQINQQAEAVSSTIQITIGRVEVRATSTPTQPRNVSIKSQSLSLGEYLKQRNGSR